MRIKAFYTTTIGETHPLAFDGVRTSASTNMSCEKRTHEIASSSMAFLPYFSTAKEAKRAEHKHMVGCYYGNVFACNGAKTVYASDRPVHELRCYAETKKHWSEVIPGDKKCIFRAKMS